MERLLKKMMLVTDFSPASKHACDYAVQLFGKGFQERPVVYNFLHIHEPAAAVSPHAGAYVTTSARVIEDGVAALKERMSRFANQYREKYPEIYFRECLEIGPIIPTIREVAEKEGVDVIVAGTTGLKGVDRVLMGSTSLALAQLSPCPVLLVPTSSNIAIPEKIVLATDFSNLEKKEVLQEIKHLANDLSVHLMVLHVHTKKTSSQGHIAQINALETYFENRNFNHYVLEEKDVSHGIKDFVVGYGADILALVWQPRTFVNRVFHHSLRKKILAGLSMPLFILHPCARKKNQQKIKSCPAREAQ